MRADEVVQDLRDEQADLARIVDTVELTVLTPAVPWDVRDCVSHLLVGDREGYRAATNPEGFLAGLTEVAQDPQGYVDSWLLVGKELSREELLTRWARQFAELADCFATLPTGIKIPWYGPPMSPASFATARLMEYWAHGQDIADAAGAERIPTHRLRHIAHLGVRTRGFSYALRGRPLPEGEVRVTLSAPDGSTWEWGSGDDAIEGTALDFSLRVTQRRHLDDLALTATGPLAREWLDIAQCFAGLPGEGRNQL